MIPAQGHEVTPCPDDSCFLTGIGAFSFPEIDIALGVGAAVLFVFWLVAR